MRIAAVMLVAAATIWCAAAKAAPAVELFQEFGLFGTWAADCAQAASPTNPHVSITAASAGQVLEEHNLGVGFTINRYSMVSGERLSAEQLSVETIFAPGSAAEEHEKLIFRVHDRTRRTMLNQPENGAAYVKDGIALANGKKAPLLQKCD